MDPLYLDKQDASENAYNLLKAMDPGRLLSVLSLVRWQMLFVLSYIPM